ncbi:MAG: DUF2163 domain-containing protein [Pseudomonadota bacterium]
MRIIPAALQAHLDTGATTLCTCWRIARKDGVVLGFTDHDRALSFGGTTYQPETGADGARIVSSADLSVDNSEIVGALDAAALSAEDLAAGKYDDADVEIWRVNWADVAERVLLKSATIGETTRAGEAFTAELRGLSHQLSGAIGRVYQRHCDAVVGDARCGVNLTTAAFKGAGVVSAVLDEHRFSATGLSSFENNWFAHGVITWTSGANAGLTAHVKSSGAIGAASDITLWLPAANPVAIGDGFDVTAGCDRRHETCTAKFSNLVNFRGFHLMPGNDFAVSYPIRSDENDGGKL